MLGVFQPPMRMMTSSATCASDLRPSVVACAAPPEIVEEEPRHADGIASGHPRGPEVADLAPGAVKYVGTLSDPERPSPRDEVEVTAGHRGRPPPPRCSRAGELLDAVAVPIHDVDGPAPVGRHAFGGAEL